jgi:hypothetical protein
MKKFFFIVFGFALLSGCGKDSGSADFSANPSPTGVGGSTARFTIVGNYLYAVNKESLKVFDISDPSSPVYKKAVPVGFEIETIYPFSDKLFIGSTSVVHIFSIADPSNPQKLGEAISPTVVRRCDPVVAKDTVAYATLRATGSCGGTVSILAVYDIHNINTPVQKFQLAMSEPYGLGYSGNTLYVCDKLTGLMVYDISSPYHPVFIKSIPGSAFIDVIPYNDVLICWTKTGMALFDITNRQNPSLISQIN